MQIFVSMYSMYNAVRLYICSKGLQYQINDNGIYLWLILLLFKKISIIKKYYIQKYLSMKKLFFNLFKNNKLFNNYILVLQMGDWWKKFL